MPTADCQQTPQPLPYTPGVPYTPGSNVDRIMADLYRERALRLKQRASRLFGYQTPGKDYFKF